MDPRSPVRDNPVVSVRRPIPAATNRTFSKRILIAVLAALTALTAYGLYSQHPDTAGIIAEYGMWSLGLVATYMAVGQLDYRTSKGVPGIMDILTLLITRGRAGRHGGDE